MEPAERNYELMKKAAEISARLLYRFLKEYAPEYLENFYQKASEFKDELTMTEQKTELYNLSLEAKNKLDSIKDFLKPKDFEEFSKAINELGEFDKNNFCGNTLILNMLNDRLADIKNNINFSSKDFKIEPAYIRSITAIKDGAFKKDNFLEGAKVRAYSNICKINPLKIANKAMNELTKDRQERERIR